MFLLSSVFPSISQSPLLFRSRHHRRRLARSPRTHPPPLASPGAHIHAVVRRETCVRHPTHAAEKKRHTARIISGLVARHCHLRRQTSVAKGESLGCAHVLLVIEDCRHFQVHVLCTNVNLIRYTGGVNSSITYARS